MSLYAQELENITNKCAEQTGKTCISSLLSKSYNISSLHKNIIICLIRKHLYEPKAVFQYLFAKG